MKNRSVRMQAARSVIKRITFIGFVFFSVVSQATGSDSQTVTKVGIDEYTTIHKVKDKQLVKAVSSSMTDHSKFKALQGPFEDGPAVTKACLECHNEAGHAFMQNKHWTWKYTDPDTGQQLGKSVLVNNFCTNARGNEGMCAQCHAGYNMTDSNFDFSNQNNIDCLVCHESSGQYYKTPPTTGNEACEELFEGKNPIDFALSAKSVVNPQRSNCGTCHFYGGGGDNVKHGDLSSALVHPDKNLDVHMDANGNNFACTDCHVGEKHQWSGSRYQMVPVDERHPGKPGEENPTASCASCHSDKPHHSTSLIGLKLNDHTEKVACETCHIPEFARGGVATKIGWDWRTAGKTKDGVGFKESKYTQGNGEHRYTYKSIKGDFTYGENIIPEYYWFNGRSHYTTIDTKFDPTKPVEINNVEGTPGGKDSRITPFKRMQTIQPYDKGNNTLVYMHLWGDDPDSFWGNYDFAKAIEHGMSEYDIPYSGEYDFIETYSYWPINHMVAPEEKALECKDCHSQQSRLAGLTAIYIPGHTKFQWLDILGLFLVAGTLGGVLVHGLIRMFTKSKSKEEV